MDTTVYTKNDFIKFNVSPTFKALAEKKAGQYGMTLSELGRMLFGTLISDMGNLPLPNKIEEMAQLAKQNFTNKKGRSFTKTKDAVTYLQSL